MAGDDSSSKKNEALSIPGRYQGPSAAAPYPLSRMAPAFDLVDIARQIQDSHQTIATMTEGKLKLLADQMRAIQEKAQTLLEKAKRDAELHTVPCRFEKRAGGVYHLYRNEDGSLWFSRMAPDEWPKGAPAFVASYRLDADMSFTDVNDPAQSP